MWSCPIAVFLAVHMVKTEKSTKTDHYFILATQNMYRPTKNDEEKQHRIAMTQFTLRLQSYMMHKKEIA